MPAGPEFLEDRDRSASAFLPEPSEWRPEQAEPEAMSVSPVSSSQLFLRQEDVAGGKSFVAAGQRIQVGLKLYWPQVVCGIALFFSAVVFGGVAFLWCQAARDGYATQQAMEAAERAHFLEA